MVDVHDKATRSKNMRAIATRDTAIEKRLASLLTGQGLAFRVQDASLPGRPDFVVDEYRCVIFTHGCFWHHHHCYLFKVPATRTEFWLEKIGKNVERDRRDISRLQELGWRVLIVWECGVTWAREADGCGAYRASGRVDLRRRCQRADRHAGDSFTRLMHPE
ncbi:patch repair protein [Escherichia coli]|uniref:Patch repair protein n=3 Tax=Escherichia coli TaxID=562 RepID=A0A484X3W4_ECOLX|nr:patch repair protein [Escherichia coli]